MKTVKLAVEFNSLDFNLVGLMSVGSQFLINRVTVMLDCSVLHEIISFFNIAQVLRNI